MEFKDYLDRQRAIRAEYQLAWDQAFKAYQEEGDRRREEGLQKRKALQEERARRQTALNAAHPDRSTNWKAMSRHQEGEGNLEHWYYEAVAAREFTEAQARSTATWTLGDREETLKWQRDEKLKELEWEWQQAEKARQEERRRAGHQHEEPAPRTAPPVPPGHARDLYRSFHKRFHPDRHLGRPYHAHIEDLAKEVNATWDRQPHDVAARLLDLTDQAERLVR